MTVSMKRLGVAIGVLATIASLVYIHGSYGLAASEKDDQAKASDRVDTLSAKNFEETVKAITKSIQGKGMMVVATIDHQKMLSMVGVKMQGSKTIEFGKPDMGKMIFRMHPEAGLEMPAKVYIFENAEGKTQVSYRKSHYAAYNPKFAEVDNMMGMMMAEIVREGTK